MTHVDLFSGIGGFALAAQWAGFRTVAFCEIDPYAQEILKQNFGSIPVSHAERCNGGENHEGKVPAKRRGIEKAHSLADAQDTDRQGSGRTTHQRRRYSEIRGCNQQDGKPQYWPPEPEFCGMANELPKGLDEGEIDGKTKITRSVEILRKSELSEGSDQETLSDNNRGHGSVQAAKILRSDLHGGRDGPKGSKRGNSSQKSTEVSQIELREVRHDGEFSGSPYGRRLVKQFTGEPQDLVRLLSYEVALGEWETAVQATVGVQSLRYVCAEIGYVPETLSALQEVWRSLSHEEASWIAIRLITGNPFHSEWPRVPRVATGVKHRVDRLKGLGNAIVPQVAYEIIKEIAEIEKRATP